MMQPLTAIASLFVVAGLLLLSRRHRAGWLCQFAGSLLSAIHFLWVVPDLSVFLLNVVLGGIALRTFFRWCEQDEEVTVDGPDCR